MKYWIHLLRGFGGLPQTRWHRIILASLSVFCIQSRSVAAEPCHAVISRFWEQRSRFCERVRQSALFQDENPPPAEIAAQGIDSNIRSQVQVFCGVRSPEVAAASDSIRMAYLFRLATHLGDTQINLESAIAFLDVPTRTYLADLLSESEIPEAGPVADALVKPFVEAGCNTRDVASWLPSTCGASLASVTALRHALLVDMARLPLRLLERNSSGLDLRAAVALVSALIESPSIFGLARSLAPELPNLCGRGRPNVPNPVDVRDTSAVAAILLARVLEDGGYPRFDQEPEHYVRVTVQILRDAGRLPLERALSSAQRSAVTGLVNALGRAYVAENALENSSGFAKSVAFRDLALTWLDVLERTLTLVENRTFNLSAARDWIEAVVIGNVEGLLNADRTLLGPDSLPDLVLKFALASSKLSAARSEDDAKEAVRAFLLPQWLTGIILDASVGAPVVNTNKLSLAIDGTAGWEARRWGFWVNGARRLYDAQLGGRDSSEVQSSIHGRAWANIQDLSQSVGVSFGLDIGFDQFYSDLTMLDASAVTSYEVSQIVRAGLSSGLWARSGSLMGRLSLSTGLHREYYSRDVTVPFGTDAGVSSTEVGASSGDYRLRLLLSQKLWTDILGVSLQGRFSYFQLSRSTAFFSYDFAQSFISQNATISAARLDAAVRLQLELELLAISNLIRPGLYGELSYINVSDGSNSLTKTLPIVGVLLRSHVPD